MAKTKAEPRRLAWEVLQEVEAGAFADAHLARRLRDRSLDIRDRALTTLLVYGTITWQGLSDHILSAMQRPADRLDVELRTLLRLALFQLVKLDRVPDFAVVDTSVELAKSHRGGGGSGLVNALLRRFLRDDKNLRLPDERDTARYLAVSQSHPQWMVELWMQQLGSGEAALLLAANNEAAPTVLRTNSTRGSREAAIQALQPLEARPTQLSTIGIECGLRGPVTELAAYRNGLVTPQGEASQLVGDLVPLTNSKSVLDACAAPGGKTTHLAERAPDGCRVTALDRSRSGLDLMRANAERLGVHVDTACADATAMPFGPDVAFDAVLVDAPCSGLGTLRQHPEIRWRRQPDDVRQLARRQAAILGAIAQHVRPGGSLVYSTCTIAVEENEERVARFLEANTDFKIDDPRPDLPESARALVGTDNFLRTYPHHHSTDGFFAARLRR